MCTKKKKKLSRNSRAINVSYDASASAIDDTMRSSSHHSMAEPVSLLVFGWPFFYSPFHITSFISFISFPACSMLQLKLHETSPFHLFYSLPLSFFFYFFFF
ncbi:hypothetical protein Pfo_009980 [Paulownia fortunei]|nr:hypothetical protein Pfo_009980 [Paulownia fortunei]